MKFSDFITRANLIYIRTLDHSKEKNYRLDECILNELEKKSMDEIGCVTPFGRRKDNICKDDNKSIEAFKLYNNFMKNGIRWKNLSCFEPCSNLGIKIINGKEYNNSKDPRLELYFNEYIHETINYYSYDDLSFLAEVGGYVGLFLGVSVYQIADLLATVPKILRNFWK